MLTHEWLPHITVNAANCANTSVERLIKNMTEQTPLIDMKECGHGKNSIQKIEKATTVAGLLLVVLEYFKEEETILLVKL